ncbi:iron ABC transporter permease [Isoptericola sp. NEAU-Y5]|uniref:Iron ABC transporter permease n=1 Tax=Isoptericola luteus TaxID=2879484 RepID=A0ABS7ZIE4_9MICO|nr:iron ABC transporter permease [Isoptericola sp. NEAU-Y5]MCA5894252.1 iron ABC transporter permease [Isoptericola sp. NEAU-Y5]
MFLGLFFAWPVTAIVAQGVLPDDGAGGRTLDLSGFAEVLGDPRTWRIVGQTLGQATAGTLLAVVLGLPGAYVLYRCRFRGRTLVRGLVTVPFVLPSVVVGVAFRTLFAPGGPLGWAGLEESFAGIVLALVFFNYAVVVRTVGGLWERLDPRAEQAARALGATPWRAFRTVTLPALGPAIASAAAVVFLFCSTAFGVVLVLGGIRYGTIETEIWVRTTQFLDLRAAAVLSVLQLVVVVAALLLGARARTRRERALHLTSERAAAHRLRLRSRPDGSDLAPAVVTAFVVLGLLALPMAGLVARSFRAPDGSWGLDNYVALGTTGGRNALSVTVWEATGNSLRTAALAALIAVVVGALVALVVSRRPRSTGARRAVGTLDALFMLPLGVSAVTVGFGFLITLDRPLGLDLDLRTAGVLVPIAQAVVAIPLVVRTVLPVLRAIDPRLREVAATLGSAPGRVLRTVDAPMGARSLGLAVGFAFAVSLGEFGATSFLARPDTATLPVVIYRLIGRPGAENYGMALAASVVLAVLTATVMMVAERLRGDRPGGEF